MNWSRDKFGESAIVLCRALEKFHSREGAKAETYSLRRWEVKQGDRDNSIYLEHPAIYTSEPLNENDEDYPLEDGNIYDDLEQHVEKCQGSSSIQWNFSVHFSDTYRVPVLYFHVQHNDGSQCGRSELLQWLPPTSKRWNNVGSTVGDSWEFVSQEEHPQTGFPSYFLHPCQTSARMKLLNCENAETETSTLLLWSWLSMILPAVKQPIPVQFFRAVQELTQES